MKILITEKQLIKLKESKESLEYIKAPLFKYWNTKGFDTSQSVLKLFGIEDNPSLLLKWMIEWYGGYEELSNILEQYSNKVYRCQLGTYDFKFKVSNFRLSGDLNIDELENFWFDAEVDGNGEVYIDQGDGNIVDNVYDAHSNEDYGWEVDEEMKEGINLKMFIEITTKTGIPVICDFMSVTEKGMFEE